MNSTDAQPDEPNNDARRQRWKGSRVPRFQQLVNETPTHGPKRKVTWVSANLAQQQPADEVRRVLAMVSAAGRVCEGIGRKHGLNGADVRCLLGIVASADSLLRVRTIGGVDWIAVHSAYYGHVRQLLSAGMVQRVPGKASGYAQIEVTPTGQRVAAECSRKIEQASNELRAAMRGSK